MNIFIERLQKKYNIPHNHPVIGTLINRRAAYHQKNVTCESYH